jgi:hypothetical protein
MFNPDRAAPSLAPFVYQIEEMEISPGVFFSGEIHIDIDSTGDWYVEQVVGITDMDEVGTFQRYEIKSGIGAMVADIAYNNPNMRDHIYECAIDAAS